MQLTPLGDSAFVLVCGDEPDDSTLVRVGAVAEALRHAALPGVLDVVPAFVNVTVYYDVAHTGPYAAFEGRVAEVARQAEESTVSAPKPRTVDIPVCYGGEFGPDLQTIAERAHLRIDQAIELHASVLYRVLAIGFVPGFAYLGGVPAKLHTPRRATPRPSVAAGSVGIGGTQTGIYPYSTPGGWNLIGRTPLAMFDVARPEPALLRAGDRVRFRAITAEEFAAWK